MLVKKRKFESETSVDPDDKTLLDVLHLKKKGCTGIPISLSSDLNCHMIGTIRFDSGLTLNTSEDESLLTTSSSESLNDFQHGINSRCSDSYLPPLVYYSIESLCQASFPQSWRSEAYSERKSKFSYCDHFDHPSPIKLNPAFSMSESDLYSHTISPDKQSFGLSEHSASSTRAENELLISRFSDDSMGPVKEDLFHLISLVYSLSQWNREDSIDEVIYLLFHQDNHPVYQVNPYRPVPRDGSISHWTMITLDKWVSNLRFLRDEERQSLSQTVKSECLDGESFSSLLLQSENLTDKCDDEEQLYRSFHQKSCLLLPISYPSYMIFKLIIRYWKFIAEKEDKLEMIKRMTYAIDQNVPWGEFVIY